MKFTTLLENTTKDKDLLANHGLSIYIETLGKKILIDTGQDDNFLINAQTLNIDISKVDFLVISHFHYDHAGGLEAFLNINKKAKVYIGKDAFDEYYAVNDGEMKPFTLNKKLFDIDRFIFVDEFIQIFEGISIISKLNYSFDNCLNEKFYKKVGEKYIKDDFSHEIALLIKEDTNTILLSGCFHSGVVNAINKANTLGDKVTHVVGGFHLAGSLKEVSQEYFNTLILFLDKNNISSYTGHCTGIKHYKIIKEKIKNKTFYINTGSKYII